MVKAAPNNAVRRSGQGRGGVKSTVGPRAASDFETQAARVQLRQGRGRSAAGFPSDTARAKVAGVTSTNDVELRFSRRVNDYLKYRPGYPDALATTLRQKLGYASDFIIADVGSGTGIASRFFLDRGNFVYAVEPNPDMRRVAHEWLGGYSKYRSVDACAEATTLPDDSVDLVVAAHSFHWFDQKQARAEFARILRPGRFVILLWNERITEGTPFLTDYERLLFEYSDAYQGASRYPKLAQESLEEFFGAELRGNAEFPNRQPVDLEGLVGRTLALLPSAPSDTPEHANLLRALASLYEQHADRDGVAFEYATQLTWGRLSRAD